MRAFFVREREDIVIIIENLVDYSAIFSTFAPLNKRRLYEFNHINRKNYVQD